MSPPIPFQNSLQKALGKACYLLHLFSIAFLRSKHLAESLLVPWPSWVVNMSRFGTFPWSSEENGWERLEDVQPKIIEVGLSKMIFLKLFQMGDGYRWT